MDAAVAVSTLEKKITSRDANLMGQTVAASKTSKASVATTKQAVAVSKTSRVSVPATKVSVAARNQVNSDARGVALNAKVYSVKDEEEDLSGGRIKDANNAKGQKSTPTKKKGTNAKAAKERTKAKAAPILSPSLNLKTKITTGVWANPAAARSRLVDEVTEAETSVASYEMSIGETSKGECLTKSNIHSTTARKKIRSDVSGKSRSSSNLMINEKELAMRCMPRGSL